MTTDERDLGGRPPAMDDDTGLPAARPAGGGIAFEGSAEFARVLHAALAHAAAHATRRLCWCDDDFQAWPLGDADWVSHLTRWARTSGRELVMIARDWTAVERRHPRFVLWRRDWAHVVQCLVPDETRTAALPTLWLDSDDQVLRVFDSLSWRGRAGFDRVDRQRAREDLMRFCNGRRRVLLQRHWACEKVPYGWV